LAQQVSNLDLDIHEIFNSQYVRLARYQINVSDQTHKYFYLGPRGFGPAQYGPPDIDLHLVFYIDQMAQIAKEDIFSELENNIASFCEHVQGQFVERMVEPFRESYATSVSYRLKIYDYERFEIKLRSFAQAKLDKEFIEALEKELSKN
jgi:hypothetical protein